MEPQLDLALQARHWVRRDKPGPHRLMCAMADEIERLREEVEELRQHRCLWGNDPSGPYVPDEYIHGVASAAATARDVTRANDATGHQE